MPPLRSRETSNVDLGSISCAHSHDLRLTLQRKRNQDRNRRSGAGWTGWTGGLAGEAMQRPKGTGSDGDDAHAQMGRVTEEGPEIRRGRGR